MVERFDDDLEQIANDLWKENPNPTSDYILLILIQELREIKKVLSKKET